MLIRLAVLDPMVVVRLGLVRAAGVRPASGVTALDDITHCKHYRLAGKGAGEPAESRRARLGGVPAFPSGPTRMRRGRVPDCPLCGPADRVIGMILVARTLTDPSRYAGTCRCCRRRVDGGGA